MTELEVFCIWTEHRDLKSKSLYPVQIRENTIQNKSPSSVTFHSVGVLVFFFLPKVIVKYRFNPNVIFDFEIGTTAFDFEEP